MTSMQGFPPILVLTNLTTSQDPLFVTSSTVTHTKSMLFLMPKQVTILWLHSIFIQHDQKEGSHSYYYADSHMPVKQYSYFLNIQSH